MVQRSRNHMQAELEPQKIIGYAITALAVLLNRVADTPQQAGAYGCSFYQSLAVYRYRPVQKGKTRRNKYVMDDVKK